MLRGLALAALCAGYAVGAVCAVCALGVGCAEPTELPDAVASAEGVRLLADGGPLRALSAERVAMAGEDQVEASGVSAELAGGIPLTIVAEKSSWELKTRRAVFEGAVVAERGPFHLSCQRLEVQADEAGAPSRAVATGDVRVSRAPWEARGSSAELQLPAGVLTLTGSPRVSDGHSELSGERVVLHMDDERIECENCTLVLPDPLHKGGP